MRGLRATRPTRSGFALCLAAAFAAANPALGAAQEGGRGKPPVPLTRLEGHGHVHLDGLRRRARLGGHRAGASRDVFAHLRRGTHRRYGNPDRLRRPLSLCRRATVRFRSRRDTCEQLQPRWVQRRRPVLHRARQLQRPRDGRGVRGESEWGAVRPHGVGRCRMDRGYAALQQRLERALGWPRAADGGGMVRGNAHPVLDAGVPEHRRGK